MYNTNPITLAEASNLAKKYIKSGICPLFISPPGIGKTTMVENIARDMKANLRHLRLNSIPPEEAIGLQFLDHETRRTIRYAPEWLPAADGSDGETIVFLDELLQAPDEYRKGIMSALLERYLGQHRIPDNCYFIAAGNSTEDGSNVFDLDRATADRFGTILIRPDFISWANDYAGKNGVHPGVVGYLRQFPQHFELTDPDSLDNEDMVIKPSPRSWTALARFLSTAFDGTLTDQEIKAGINGKVGSAIGASVWALMGVLKDLPTLEDLLRMTPEQRKKATPDRMDVLWSYGQAMIWYANDTDKILMVMDLLDDFNQAIDLPFVEFRTNVVETILSRARTVHNVSCVGNKAIADKLIAWDHAKRAAAAGLSSANDANVVTCQQIAA